ncbi:hypothetical protein GIB67_007361 [Kingdonia uniflora]|uniref:HNH nuclease domain-containing protein n=1 Tax=Kingdonia uniflora TaxID=39325 RepID=A0A7J7NXN8_9MAGN|nr:hypothetical protein GIB67_007361 [Kingdonia uniflora]
MRPKKEGRRRRNSSSPTRTRTSIGFGSDPNPYPFTVPRASSSSLQTSQFLTEEEEEEGTNGFRISPDYITNPNPRSFPYNVKQQCWEKAEKIKGRDPDRWRRDALGNTLFRKLVGCPGCLCHDYDHIVPYSKGGKSTLENCQVLQATVNRSKGNRTEISNADLIQKSSYCRVSGRDLDLLEISAYGNVRRGQDTGGGCILQ